MAEMKFLPVFFDSKTLLTPMTDEQFGRVIRAAMMYMETGTKPTLEPIEEIGLQIIINNAERSADKYEKRKEAAAKRWSDGCNSDANECKPMQTDANGMQTDASDMQTDANEYNTDANECKGDANAPKNKEQRTKNNISPNGDIEDGFAVPARAKKKTAPEKRFVPPTPDEVNAYCAEHGYNVDGEAFVDHYQRTGWILKGNVPMKNWQAAVRTWVHYDKERRNNGGQSSGYKPDNNYGDMMAFLNAEIAKGGLDIEQSRDSPDTQSAEDSISGVLFEDAPF